ncbi:hypothetical protein Tco_0243157 [Tanacetum coccineum]
MFDQGLAKEITEMKEVINQMETKVAKCYVERKCFEIQKKTLILKNDRLLELIISQDLVHTVVNSLAAIVDYQSIKKSYLDEYNECLNLKADLSKKNEMVEKVVYNELSKRCSRLENYCISLEIEKQQSNECLGSNKPCQNLDTPEFKEFFEINNLKAQLKGKDTKINNLKKHIGNLKGKAAANCSETINCSRVIILGMYKLELEPLSPKLRKDREAHMDYLKKAEEHAATLHDIVEQARAQQPLDSALDHACKFTKCIKELLVYVSATCPSSLHVNGKLVAITPTNKSKKVRFEEPKKSTSNTPT